MSRRRVADVAWETWLEGEVVSVKRTEAGYAVGIKHKSAIQHVYSEKPIPLGSRVRITHNVNLGYRMETI